MPERPFKGGGKKRKSFEKKTVDSFWNDTSGSSIRNYILGHDIKESNCRLNREFTDFVEFCEAYEVHIGSVETTNFILYSILKLLEDKVDAE